MLIAGGGFFIYVKDGFSKYVPGPYIASYHKYVGSFVMLACYFSFYMASTVDPGIIKN